jgi:HD-GYP domain-containing protein (c-di-GMP phosphodiesterase class II)/cAMP phosphodiesterase
MLKDDIKFLGTSGSKKEGHGSSCVQVTDTIVIDAGNIINGLEDDAKHIEHIFLTHSHLDHISDIAFLVDTYFVEKSKPLKVYGLKETLEALNEHIFNWSIWPDFQEISLIDSEYKSVEFIEIQIGKEYTLDEVTLKPIALNHTVPTCGYVIKKENISMVYASDTYTCERLWKEINEDKTIKDVVIDVSFPSEMDKLAKQSKHLTPMLLKDELKKLTRDDVSIYVTHIKPNYKNLVEKELDILKVLLNNGRVIKDGEYLKSKKSTKNTKLKALTMSTVLSKEKDLNKILGLILEETMDSTNAEGGTIYLKEKDTLSFKAVKNDALNIFEVNQNYPKINLYPEGKENRENVSAVCALTKEIINIPDIYLYHIGDFNFDGAKKFDKANDYKTQSMLVIPMLNQDEDVIGVMQLINKKSLDDALPFTQDDINLASTYANLSASAITKNMLIEDLEKLVISFLESISYALSVKSPYGYGHISRVKELMGHVAREIDNDNTIFKDVNYTKEEHQELELAAWMHDIGKIATPEHIIDKATRLETVYDRIDVIQSRFEHIKYFLKAEFLESKCKFLSGEYELKIDTIENKHIQIIQELDNDFAFLQQVNTPSFCLKEEDLQRVKDISEKSFMIDDEKINLLTKDEFENLSIVRGTLSDKERDKVNEHAKITYDMLKMITFPKKYSNVTEIASRHHEKLNGQGYPLGLSAKDLSLETRMLAIVDILEALTASDRPYKRAKTYDETFEILEEMVDENEIDGKIVSFIKEVGIFEKYIQKEEKQEAKKALA